MFNPHEQFSQSKMISMCRTLIMSRRALNFEQGVPLSLSSSDIKGLDKGKYNHGDVYNQSSVGSNQVYWADVFVPPRVGLNRERMVAARCAEIEDGIVFNLVHTAVGNVVNEHLDFGTNGNAVRAVDYGIRLLSAGDYDSRFGSNLFLPRIQYYQLIGSINGYGASECDVIRELLAGGDIYQTELPAGQGVLLPVPQHTTNTLFINCDWDYRKYRSGSAEVYRIFASFGVYFPVPKMGCNLNSI